MLRHYQQMEEERLKKTAELQQVRQSTSASALVKPQSTITPFKRDYKDWIHFWNQFSVEVDGLVISKISKFNYLWNWSKGNLGKTYLDYRIRGRIQ